MKIKQHDTHDDSKLTEEELEELFDTIFKEIEEEKGKNNLFTTMFIILGMLVSSSLLTMLVWNKLYVLIFPEFQAINFIGSVMFTTVVYVSLSLIGKLADLLTKIARKIIIGRIK